LIFYSFEENEGGNMTQQLYVDKILPLVKEYRDQAEAKGHEFIFQEDNDGGHGTRSEENIVKMYKDKINLDYIDDWPPWSPDLSPIENVWRILKQRVRQHLPKNKQELKRAIEVEWEALTLTEINNVVWCTKKGGKWTMYDRMKAVLDGDGKMTEY
jgi:DDE superfamily endonuclease